MNRAVVLLFAVLAGPLSAGLIESPQSVPGGTDAVLAVDVSAGAIPRNFAAITWSSAGTEKVLLEHLNGFAADTGIDLTAPMSLVVAGPRARPQDTLVTGRLKVDAAKLAGVLKPMADKLKIKVEESPTGLLVGDATGAALFRPDGTFALGRREAVTAASSAAPGAAAPAPEAAEVIASLSNRAGANATGALLLRTPQGLPGNPGAANIAGQPIAGFWPRFRSLFIAVREKDFALELGFDSPEAANAAKPIIEGGLKILDGQLGAEEARAKAEAETAGPFKHLDARWLGAHLSLENWRALQSSLNTTVDGSTLALSIQRGSGSGGPNLLVSSAVIGVLAAIAVPNFKAARERANWRACFANQKTIVGAQEMYNLDKNTKREGLDMKFFEELKAGGYLQSIPNDPGQGEGTATNYYSTTTGNGIACKVHGDIGGEIKGSLPQPGTAAAPSANPMDAAIKSLFGPK